MVIALVGREILVIQPLYEQQEKWGDSFRNWLLFEEMQFFKILLALRSLLIRTNFQALGTAEMVVDVVLDRTGKVDSAPFAVDRALE